MDMRHVSITVIVNLNSSIALLEVLQAVVVSTA